MGRTLQSLFCAQKGNNNLTEAEYKRFKIEFEQMEKLNSPYVIEVYKFDDNKREYIMEYASETLQNYISKRNNKLEIRERIYLARQVFRAFSYINSEEVLHRDISTTSILIITYDELPVIKVSDFGLVKLKNSNLTRKETEIKGSLNDPKLELVLAL